MWRLAVVVVSVFIQCTLAQDVDSLFLQYAGDDNLIQRDEFDRFWLHFDQNSDGSVTKNEFDMGWRLEGFPKPQNAPFFFLELDRVADEILNFLDFPHIFRLFDEDGNGEINDREMIYNWRAYFI
ncbi:uncharacterized protein LOC131939220 [Physella acuta]|uniref:uncharacterized protein LOC131939220 n=1 Tax=Physella acuta TaxID=109671 RepID=UPI0027DC0E84|nr:uncharacterized protein LOC131939220 [Physella acuta]